MMNPACTRHGKFTHPMIIRDATPTAISDAHDMNNFVYMNARGAWPFG